MGQNLASVHPTADTWAQVDAQIATAGAAVRRGFAGDGEDDGEDGSGPVAGQ